ncbi:hypothetical protein AtubIFM57258_005709 [Aspergillus tubingensis]|uniref:LEA domain protein n=3 Tax=Aspergillus subgen. Circumdati TaxID=2720871 RepID=A0A317UW21_ASPEC|nr:uncharacterized protein BO83DRAFT_430977 [Aspergillus eucalypticola CBS 122712]XP_025479021.1 hypothetical protein BO87DRAFT_310050 [Aspergillus neoniger CBS 115656]XP_025535516.1 hypothetical protein BO79DRAFT_211237 [Aspergillus costaricaensis CBS 115574]GLB09781.1 hypothetical protein AtubIFM57258_005709 [Aspergillus tubingensis]PWY64672.1 hypothetical protein BO83DRAFT_430977 [Aspergillus eucalypticola CBS 122712]PYH33543.1 hypothetical protein BO87DRAFT_310050 [Aspergillus neoniger CBS
MSFLARIAPAARTASLSLRPTTTPALSVGATRSISATARRDKGPIDATKETLKKADRKVSDAAVKGIEVGENAAEKVKGTVSSTASEAKAKTDELSGEASQVAGQGKGKAEETLGTAKGKAQEAAGEVKGKAQEAAGEVKGKAKETAGRF